MTDTNGTPAATPAPRILYRVLLIETTTDNDGVREVEAREASVEEMAALGWIRSDDDANGERWAKLARSMAASLGPAAEALAESISTPHLSIPDLEANGHGVNGGTASPHASCSCADPKFEQRGFIQWCAGCDRPKHWDPSIMGASSTAVVTGYIGDPVEKPKTGKLISDRVKELLRERSCFVAADRERAPIVQAILDALDERWGRG